MERRANGLSDLLTQHLRDEVARAHNGDLDSPELKALEPLLQRQKDLSTLPTTDQLLIETCHTKEVATFMSIRLKEDLCMRD